MLAFWVGFHILIAIALILDLGVFHRRARAMGMKEAIVFSASWICLALLFNIFIYFSMGGQKALEFFTGYLIEKSLSIDNLFVFLLIFQYFRIPLQYQRKVHLWGILGAIVFRICFIVGGIALIEQFSWIYYVFGAILLITGARFVFQKEKKGIEESVMFRFMKKVIPFEPGTGGGRFFSKGKATSLLGALILIECADVIFAVDSIPAVFAVTQDPFIVYTSNIFAILGLRSLYFVLAGSLHKLRYLKYGLGAILVFIGAKMLLGAALPISVGVCLAVVAGILGVTIWASKK